MDTVAHEETSVSTASAVTGAAGVLLSAVLVVPGLLVPAYARLVTTALLLLSVGGAIRFLVSVAVAAVPRPPPADALPHQPPTVSLVVTAYDEADVLPATIEACRAVDYPEDRLQVVVAYESASTDGTTAVAEAAAEGDSRVTAVERTAPPGGKASATNHALGAATGEIVGILDADQRLEPDAVARAVRWFEDEDVWCLTGRCLGRNAGESLLAACATVERGIVERIEFVARDRLGGFAIFTGGQAFLRASALEAVGTFDDSVLLEDLDMAYRVQREGGAVRVDPGVVTRDRNPVTLSAWWNQRKRWARGGMQVARRYLGSRLVTGPPSRRTRADFAATLGALLALPVLVLATPLLPLAWSGFVPASIAPWLWGTVFATPFVASGATFAVDRLAGFRYDPPAYAAALLLWPYVALQLVVLVVAFLEEFVLRRPTRYVTS